ncbi:MAG: hypothetical protein GY797_33085 [Deltaproteobacteria bacterium]|nr:hypothetical protein [Deltaproteobacteria bacterium]
MEKKHIRFIFVAVLVSVFTVSLTISNAAAEKADTSAWAATDAYIKENVKGEKPLSGAEEKSKKLVAVKVDAGPVIDGKIDDVWGQAQGVYVWDTVAKINIMLKTVYTDGKIFLLVKFNDPDESRKHKYWHWNKEEEMYEQGPEREDIFTVKWNMNPGEVDLSAHADNEYRADIWFWKSNRTGPVGYADDKIQKLTVAEIKGQMKVISRSGNIRYLTRIADEGRSAYEYELPIDHAGDIIPKYTNRQPQGSRADVKAKGFWKDGSWAIEFKRDLATGNSDDVQFDISSEYQLGVSRYEISARKPNLKTEVPLYGSGDTNNSLRLSFDKK